VIDPISTEFPRFFTPNFDGFNDCWPYESLNDDNIESIAIFDRYGKLLKTLYPNDGGWNGIYNGEQMPSSDYWYTAMMKDGSALNNHFTLKR
jgi:gliding motility-associated-like protein